MAEADDEAWAGILEQVDERDVVAVGETGRDYDRARSPRDVQLANLRRHISLALETRKPLILHCRSKPGQRDAQDDLLEEATIEIADEEAAADLSFDVLKGPERQEGMGPEELKEHLRKLDPEDFGRFDLP